MFAFPTIENGPFIFSTGIECSNPLIQNKSIRRDLLEECGHYEHWQQDFDLITGLGIKHVRYGLPTHSIMVGPGKYDWSFPDLVLPKMRAQGIEPILDLLHFGLPDWLGDFQNPEFPRHFADYAGEVARRYPWVRMWTPINEMFVTAKMSARKGAWNEQLSSEFAFVTALKHLVKASLLAIEAIVEHCPDAVIIPSESVEYMHSTSKEPHPEAKIFNAIRLLSLDWLYGREHDADLAEYVRANGATEADLDWFRNAGRPGRHVIGLDYYGHNEFVHHPCGRRVHCSDDGVDGFALMAKEYFDRYNLPIFLAETNYWNHERSPQWLWKMWFQTLMARKIGVPVIGFCWYSLGDQVDWGSGLTEKNGHVNGCGLYDMQRRPNPVEPEFRVMVSEYRDLTRF